MSPTERAGPGSQAARIVFPTELGVERSQHPAAISERRFFEQLEAQLAPDARAASRPLARLSAKRVLQAADLAALGGGQPGDAHEPKERAALATVLDSTLGELAAAGTTAEDLMRTGTARGRALAEALRAFTSELASLGRFDGRRALSSGALAALLDRPAAVPEHVLLSGFVDLDAGRIAVWLAVHAASRARGGRGVSLLWPELDAAFGPLAGVAEALERQLAEQPDPFEIEWRQPSASAIAGCIEAHGSEAEARAVVRAVLDALESGTAPDGIGVVVPSGDESFLGPLRAHFEQAHIPIAEAHGPPVSHAPEARLLENLLAMAATRLDRDTIVEILRTPGLHPGSLVEKADELNATERAARMAARLRAIPVAQHRSGALFVDALVHALAADSDRGARDRWMIPAMERLNASLTALRKAPSSEAALSALLALAHDLRLGDPSATEVRAALSAEERGRTASSMRAVSAGAVAVRAMIDALEGMREATRLLGVAGEPVDLGELLIDLTVLSGDVKTAARGGAGRAGAVRVGSVREMLGIHSKLLVITRLAATSYFGRGAPSLLDETTRRALAVGRRPRSDRERVLAREAEIAWALNSADRVVLSYASTDDDGRVAEPPHACFSKAVLDGAARTVEPASRVSPAASLLSPRAAELAALVAGAPPADDVRERAAIEIERHTFFVTPSARASRFSGSIGERFAPLLVDAFGGDRPDHALAVGLVERSLVCAFRAFGERALGSRRSDDAAEALSPLERGDVLHRALFAAFEAERELAPSIAFEQRIAIARRAAEQACAVDVAESAIRRDGRARTIHDAIEVLRADLEGERRYVYREGERAFGSTQPAPWGPLVLRSPSGREVYVEGRLDRLDASPDGTALRVVDYKAGTARSRKIGETDFQVPLYALVARRLGPARTLGVYASVGQGGAVTLRPAKEADQEFDLERIAETAAAGVESLWSGLVWPRPRSLRVCQSCGLRGLCRRPAVMPSDDEALEAPP